MTKQTEAIAAKKRADMTQFIKDGETVTRARELAGFTDSAYRWNRKHHPDWASRIDFLVDAGRKLGKARVDYTLAGDLRLDPHHITTSFAEFVGKWFPDRRPHEPHQLRIADELEHLSEREVCMFLIWPEAGKTSTLEDYICRKLAFDPSHRFRYVSEAADLAKRVIGTCQRRFTDTAEYATFIERYGPFYEKGQERNGRPWTTEQITLATNPGTERDRNLVASSWTSAVYGSRIDTLILDDLQSQRNYNAAEEIFRRIRGTFFNRGLGLRTLIIGTRIGPGDFYERMLDAGLVTKQVILSVQDHDGMPKVPEFWDRMQVFHNGGPCCMGRPNLTCPRDGRPLTPKEKMDLMRFQAGEETWAAAYLQNPVSDSRSSFGEFLERCLDMDRRYGPLQRVG